MSNIIHSKFHFIIEFLKLLTPYNKFIKKSVLSSVMLTIIFIPLPYFTKILFDNIFLNRNASLLLTILLSIVIAQIASGLMRMFVSLYSVNLSLKMTYDIHLKYIRHLQYLPFIFYDTHKTGDILSRARDADGSITNCMEMIYTFINSVLSLVVIIPIIFYINWKLSLLSISVFPFLGITYYVLNKYIYDYSKKVAENKAELSSLEYEFVSGIRTVKTLGIEIYIYSRIQLLLLETQNVVFNLSKIQSAGSFIAVGLTVIGTFVYSFYGWKEVLANRLSIGSFLAFTTYIGYLHGPIEKIIGLTRSMQKTIVHSSRFFKIYEMDAEVVDKVYYKKLILPGTIQISNMSFQYDSKNPVLTDVNIIINEGEYTTIIGKSGVGKTTLFHLLCNFYKASRGSIVIGGKDINELDVRVLRDNIGIMLQEPFLFYGTIYDNLTCGDNYPYDDIIKYSKITGLDKIIENLKEGYNSVIGERGVNLSLGQKQKISLTRLLMKETPIILLDEPSSAWDKEDESRIINNITKLLPNKTIITITHKMHSLKQSDNIYVITKSGNILSLKNYQESIDSKQIIDELLEEG